MLSPQHSGDENESSLGSNDMGILFMVPKVQPVDGIGEHTKL